MGGGTTFGGAGGGGGGGGGGGTDLDGLDDTTTGEEVLFDTEGFVLLFSGGLLTILLFTLVLLFWATLALTLSPGLTAFVFFLLYLK